MILELREAALNLSCRHQNIIETVPLERRVFVEQQCIVGLQNGVLAIKGGDSWKT